MGGVLALSVVNKKLHADLNDAHTGELALFKATL